MTMVDTFRRQQRVSQQALLAGHSTATSVCFLEERAPGFPAMTSSKSKEGRPSPAPGDEPSLVQANQGSLPLHPGQLWEWVSESILARKMQREVCRDSPGKG